MSALLSGQYAGFIAAAYGITFVVLLGMIVWIALVGRSNRIALEKLEAQKTHRESSKDE